MQRLFRLSILVALIGLIAISDAMAQKPQVYVSGRVHPGDVRIFLKDSVYIINHDYVIGGTLIIEPGTNIYFHPNGRLIDSTGGRIIADGFAASQYDDRPDGINPVVNYSAVNGGEGYADMRYFLYKNGTAQTIDRDTDWEQTVHPNKYNYLFHVLLDTVNKEIVDLVNPHLPIYPFDAYETVANNDDLVIVPFEHAIMFQAAGLWKNVDNDPNLRLYPWQRKNGADIEIDKAQIRFIGQPVDNFSREWGHIVVLPGARAAFFRNCSFEGFRKDTTVDRFDYYDVATRGAGWAEVNDNLVDLTNGGGGALTTFSSRTWLLNCSFENNMARHRGGALQILQAPAGYPETDISSFPNYPVDKNPNLTEPDGTISQVVANNPIKAIDLIDEGAPEPTLGGGMIIFSDEMRQFADDGRLAVYLGRMRNLTFDRNYVQLADVDVVPMGNPPVMVVSDVTDKPASYPQTYGNNAYGGAIYIAGREGDRDTKMEIAFGINDMIKIGNRNVSFDTRDHFEATVNKAKNYQAAASSEGSRGGAIYCGENTSMIVAGSFEKNETHTKYMQNEASGTNSGYYSMGGAIFTENTFSRLQVRGGNNRNFMEIYDDEGDEITIDNATHFYQNIAGAGGAIYVDGNVDRVKSPIIGGSDVTFDTRNYGFNILFRENQAISFGGAIFTKRNISVNGGGGVQDGFPLDYSRISKVSFTQNKAGYTGGAIDIRIPNAFPPLEPRFRTCQFVRTFFTENVVGEGITDNNKAEIRGGGAIYSLNGDLNLVKGSDFVANKVYNGNGGAIAMIHPQTSSRRFFLSDVDATTFDFATGLVDGYVSYDAPFTHDISLFPPDVRMLTRFLDNEIEVDQEVLDSYSGSGATQVRQGTEVPTNKILGTWWWDTDIGYAVGYNGMVVKFSQGGYKWDFKESGTNFRLEDVVFTSQTVGYAVGDRGIILRTDDAGDTWQMVNTPTDKCLHDVTFVGTQFGWAAGDDGVILRTDNGGQTWTLQQPVTTDLYSISWTSTTTGYAVGENGTILVTYNGGNNWDAQVVTGLTSDLYNVFFKSANIGFAVGADGNILMTQDAGDTWDFVAVGATTNDLHSCYFTGQTYGYIAGQFGVILKTEDGGMTWNALDPGTTYSFSSIFFPSVNTGYVVGDAGMMLKTENAGVDWKEIDPNDNKNIVDVTRWHQEIKLPENGVGLGGAIYILDEVSTDRIGRADSIHFNRVRIENNKAFSGSAIYSDNYDLKLIFNRSLIAGNEAYSPIGYEQNVITGPALQENANDGEYDITGNFASSDLAGATIYGEIQGPLPSNMSCVAANSIYDNDARFLIRLPDAPNTKGVLAGTSGIGYGGTDTLRGNYWGVTEADVIMEVPHLKDPSLENATFETFYVDINPVDYNTLQFDFQTVRDEAYRAANPTQQGPFESIGDPEMYYEYIPIPLVNGADENTVGTNSIPERALMSGHIYDIYDKGTDIKTADYSKRRMSPIEDFAVGIPPVVKRYDDPELPSEGKYVRRLTRDPYVAEEVDEDGNLKYGFIADLLDEFRADDEGMYYHPIGYPVYLEAMMDYSDDAYASNHDPRVLNESVFFVINESTAEYIRVNLRQADEETKREIFRGRVDIVPDSSNRHNSSWRRTAEGILNIGSNGEYPFGEYSSDLSLLKKLRWDGCIEDAATLQGRRYHADSSRLCKVPKLYNNRPSMPDDQRVYEAPLLRNASLTTYWAGEKYRTLPADTGDVIRVISRTVLWREGFQAAFDDGIAFKVVHSTPPPVFTGDIVKLQTDTIAFTGPSEYPLDSLRHDFQITDFLNKIFLWEDKNYINSSQDSILSVTAIDLNGFYNANSFFGDDDASLTYSWMVDGNSALRRWMFTEQISANADPKDGALGYLVLKGHPINPFIVPGGEEVLVTAENFPPHWRTLDSLKANGLTNPDTLDKLIEVFPPYLSNPEYDVEHARYLQQDTIDIGGQYRSEYRFHIFVMDSTPRFLDPATNLGSAEIKESLDANTTVTMDYQPTEFKCDPLDDGRLVANVTNKLRFQVDINTDDEQEDQWALLVDPAWDYRFGKTAYGYANVALDGDGNEIIMGEWDFENKDGSGYTTIINQMRPTWMAPQYFYEYDSDTDQDQLGVEFQSEGKINIRIDRNVAEELLKPGPDQYHQNDEMNTDTTFAIICNDGHGGVSLKTYDIFVNFQPEILDLTLPAAVEDSDYNPQLINTNKMVHVKDPNYGQRHTFELIYPDEARDEIPYDPCFPEAGTIDLTGMKTTPEWLKINKESGILYGMPTVLDAPRMGADAEKVTVVVYDEHGLANYKQFDLEVEQVNHDPELFAYPEVECIALGQKYVDTVWVTDQDLLRVENPEELQLEILNTEVSNLALRPSQIDGPQDTTTMVVELWSDDLEVNATDGKATIIILVTDKEGKTDTLRYKLELSLPVDFLCPITIKNAYDPSDGSFNAIQVLEFGTGEFATTGDGKDNNLLGGIDWDYCEFELPPLPPHDVFDARWIIPKRNGMLRSIFPRATQGNEDVIYIYMAKFQAGGEDIGGSSSPFYPVVIEWNPDDIPSQNDQIANPEGSSWHLRDFSSNGNLFNFDMREPEEYGTWANDIIARFNGDIWQIILNNDQYDSFVILHDWYSDVEENVPTGNMSNGITKASPNPMTSNTTIDFNVVTTNKVVIDVIDNLGNVVTTLVNDVYAPGKYNVQWNGTDNTHKPLPSGNYTIRMSAGKTTSPYPVVIVR